MMVGLLNGSCDEAHAKAFGEVPPGASLYELKERAAVAAAKASQHAAAGHKALARIWKKAADRLRKELQERRESEGSLGALVRFRDGRAFEPAFRNRGTDEVVVTENIHNFEAIDPSWSTYDQWEDGFVDGAGNFYTRKEAAKVLMPTKALRAAAKKLRIDTDELESQDYQEGERQGLFGEIGELYVGKPTKLAIGLALGAGLYYGGKKLLSKVETSKPATQMRSAIEAAERAEET